MRWTIAKLFMVTSLRHAESTPRGRGFAARLNAGQVAIARALARDGMVVLGRVVPPDSGVTAALTDKGRAAVDAILEKLNGATAA